MLMELFITLKSFCESNELDETIYFNVLNDFTTLFGNLETDTITDIMTTHHIKVFCYLVEKYEEDLEEINEEDLVVIFFLVLVHIVEDRYTYNTCLLGDPKKYNGIVLDFNNSLFKHIFSINQDEKIINDYWSYYVEE